MIFNQFSIFSPYTRVGGPRFMLEFVDIDRGTDFGSGGDSQTDFNPISTLPKVITPRESAASLGGGLTLAQLDRAARFEVDEGAPIGIFYGRVLFALKLVSHLYEPGVPRNTFTGILGEGWGGLGQHGEWERIVAAYFEGEALTKRFDYTVWFEDRTPQGAVLQPDTDGWNWVAVNPKPYIGKWAHQSPIKSGTHQHFFTDATQGLAIGTGDMISCWIWIDPVNTPTEVMLQFAIGSDFEHRAYWGANSIAFGTNGTNSRRQISASVPATGEWVRLDVPASQVGVEGSTLTGMAFTLFGGAATWSQVTRWKDTTSGNSGYFFRPGIISPQVDDVVQTALFGSWPSGLTHSGSANAVFRLSTAQSAQDRPDAVKVIAECRRTFNYDATGAEIPEQYGYSPSPARVVADRLLYFFQRRFRDRLDIAEDRFRRRVFWPSWVEWRDNSAALIPWDREGDGVNVLTPRAEFHGGWTDDISMAQVLDQVCGESFTGWQDDGEQIIFLPNSTSRPPVHHFHPGNIVRAPQRSTAQSLGSRPNRFIGRFRDSESDFLEPSHAEPPDDTPEALLREDSIDRVGEIRSEHALGGMTFSQAGRAMEYVARLTHDNPVRVNLVGNATAIHLLKWDFVTVSHPELGWEHQLCLVLSVRIRSRQQAADEVEVNLQRIDVDLDVDGAHSPRQEALTL